mgnify:CR=1 FL=1
MDDRPLSILHYLPVSPRDEQWGIVCTTAGHQHVPPGTPYPVSEHPEHYLFYKGSGRTLDEYQDILASNLEEYERIARMVSDLEKAADRGR